MTANKRFDALCERFEAGWNRGETPAIEAFLVGFAGGDRFRLLVKLIAIDLAHRWERQAAALSSTASPNPSSDAADSQLPPRPNENSAPMTGAQRASHDGI